MGKIVIKTFEELENDSLHCLENDYIPFISFENSSEKSPLSSEEQKEELQSIIKELKDEIDDFEF